ncbi:MAG: Holliday junction resolvase RuvX [Armatimonadetes bacterium]|nr:Holliday junction resolvase RuvX [Armatimonadota bacterium]
MRYMGLDVGDKTIGVAMSDEIGLTANPVTVISRTGSLKREIGEIRRLVEENGIGRIVVGMPFMLDGSVGIQAEKVAAFVEEVRRRIQIPVVTWDERLTTAEVERILIASDQSREKRKKVIDKMAAAVILRSYMDRQKHVARAEEDLDSEE